MKQEDIEKWRRCLGEDLSADELAAFLAEHPELAEEGEAWAERFRRARLEISPLESDFTARVMARVAPAPKSGRVLPLHRSAWRRWTFAAGFAAAAALSLVWYRADRVPFQFPGTEIRSVQGPSGEPVYFVRFALKREGARTVAIAGDFNQWMAVDLSPSAEQEGLFTVELPLSSGIYSYAFVVDGEKWVADEAAGRLVEDGFGEKNSVIQL